MSPLGVWVPGVAWLGWKRFGTEVDFGVTTVRPLGVIIRQLRARANLPDGCLVLVGKVRTALNASVVFATLARHLAARLRP